MDSRDWASDEQVPVAYVAEELLSAPELDTDEPQSWLEVRRRSDTSHQNVVR